MALPQLTSGGDDLSRAVSQYLSSSSHVPRLPANASFDAAKHVETKYAMWMRQNGVTDMHVVINNNYVCGQPMGCQALVPAILPRDRR
ncbi:hypothetical protein Atai01_66440 [Amycolatopsis taiwanensis]|uniref:Uncharacterized protein n=1 Tax=Amycolatopsis taiwanensis TaxID=342230 RepID=A0A9W6VIT5_9PSEU|nr:hypothetical protein Atai01_66440 [Amycolatopsis taiwanensis]